MNGENLIGKVISERYEILEIVGNGGMATVYKAHDRLINRDVAVKLLKESLKDDSEIVDKFNKEAHAASSLAHSNIVSVYDVGQYEGLGYIVMELVEGKTLKEYINENKPIKWQEACEIAIQIANALGEAHEHGIVHRDIKPHNILITKDHTVKVTDFGIASVATSDTHVSGGAAMGSVHYISPEQARGGYVDKTSDLYSLGVVLYEMLTGELPFDGDNAVSIALKKLQEEPVSPKVINLDVPQDLDAIVMKSISKEQTSRYKSAAEFVGDLKELLKEDRLHIISTRRQKEEDTSSSGRKRSENPPKGFNPILASAVLALLIAVVTFFAMSGGRKEYIVPDLINHTLEEALVLVEGTEFTIDEESILYEVSEEFEEGKIMLQNPGANQSVKKNKKIQLTISSGATEGDLSVPSVIGMSYDEASALLESKELKCQVIEEEGAEEALNKVIAQTPKDGTKVTKGYTVILHVCTSVAQKTEEKQVEVPDVTGKTRADAEAILSAAGLSIGNIKKAESDSEPGTIIAQEPSAGSTVKSGTGISVTISEKAAEETPPAEEPSAQTPSAQTQAPAYQPEDSEEDTMKRKTLTINIPDSAEDEVVVRVLANGKEIHNQTHQKSEGKVDIVVQSKKDAEVEVYMNGELMVHKIINFE